MDRSWGVKKNRPQADGGLRISRDSSLNHFGKSFHFFRRVPGCAETIANLFSRELPEQLTQPFGVRARNVFGNVLHLGARDIVGDVNHSGKKRTGTQEEVHTFWCRLLN